MRVPRKIESRLIEYMTVPPVGHGRMMAWATFAFLLFAMPLLGQTPAPNSAPVSLASVSAGSESSRTSLLQQLSASMENVAANTSPAVVQIVVTGYGPVQHHGEEDVTVLAPEKALGSGVIVDPDGYIITNAHVVRGAQRIRVILPQRPSSSSFRLRDSSTGKILEGKIVGVDTDADLAVIKVEASGLPNLPLASARAARQGEMVFAIGSPEGLENSVTMGIVSSPLRQPDPDDPRVFVQTDTPINPGNSGGPLVDIDGHLVGINTMILSSGGGSEGIGFAIPAAIVRFEYSRLRKSGHVVHASIGPAYKRLHQCWLRAWDYHEAGAQ